MAKESDSGRFIATILMELSKAYDFLLHDLLIAKLEVYGLGNGSVNFLLDCLTFRKQRTKVGSTYSKYSRWSKIWRGIPEGSMLGPINDILMIIEQSAICNFADDSPLYLCGEWLTEVKQNLIFDTKGILYWPKLNSLKANPGKFQFRILGDKSYRKYKLKINSIKAGASDNVLLLGSTIDKKLTFKQLLKEQYKLHAVWRMRKSLTIERAKRYY